MTAKTDQVVRQLARMADERDPLNVRIKLYCQISKVLDDLEKDAQAVEPSFSVSERLRALGPIIAYVARIMEKIDTEAENAGSSVRKYAGLFQPSPSNAANPRAGNRRSASVTPFTLDADDPTDDGGTAA